MPLDMHERDGFMNRFVADLGATLNAGPGIIGQSLGLDKALANGPRTPAQLAQARAYTTPFNLVHEART